MPACSQSSFLGVHQVRAVLCFGNCTCGYSELARIGALLLANSRYRIHDWGIRYDGLISRSDITELEFGPSKNSYSRARQMSVIVVLSNPLFRKHRISIQTKINMYRVLAVSGLLRGHHPRRSPAPRRVQHALSMAPPACVLAAAHQQP